VLGERRQFGYQPRVVKKRKAQNPHPFKTGKNAAPGMSRERHSPEWRFVGLRFCVWMAAHVSGETWGFCFTIDRAMKSILICGMAYLNTMSECRTPNLSGSKPAGAEN
jgi:hypothetical protein